MDKTLISGKDILFAYCVTDGMLDDMSEEQRTSIIRALTESKKKILKESDRKNTKKYQNNRDSQNKGKVSK